MNPIPHVAPVPGTAMFVDGYLNLLLLLSVASLFVMFGMFLWTVYKVTCERKRLFCPVRLRSVRVLFKLAPSGARTDVLHCSVFGRRPITCGKACLSR